MELYGKQVILRAVEEDDLEILRQSTNSPDFEKMIVGWTLPISKRDQKDWFEYVKNSKDLIRLTITYNNEPVGLISLSNIDYKNGKANLSGIRITSKPLGAKGLATDAMMTLLKYCFYELRLNRVYGSALEYNQASLRVCEKVGFKREGIERESIFKNGQYINLIILGCLKTDYDEVVKQTNY